MKASASDDYQELVARFRDALRRFVPPNAVTLVVSRGDDALLDTGVHRTWHFPQRADGVYLGHHPADDASAVAHLEELRKRGGRYLAIPQTSLWWLEHYGRFREHLERHGQVVFMEREVGAVYALGDESLPPAVDAGVGSAGPEAGRGHAAPVLDQIRAIFDLAYYREQGATSKTVEAAVADYLKRGFRKGWSPCRLFDPQSYASSVPGGLRRDANPLVDYLTRVDGVANPHPCFDSEYYRSQVPELEGSSASPLVHYLSLSGLPEAPRPNALFSQSWYVESHRDVLGAGVNPFVHFLTAGLHQRRWGSGTLKGIAEALFRPSRQHLLRGNWRWSQVLLISDGVEQGLNEVLLRIGETLGRERHARCMLLLDRKGMKVPENSDVNVVFLEQYSPQGDLTRPASRRLLLECLRAAGVELVIATSHAVHSIAVDAGIPSLLAEAGRLVGVRSGHKGQGAGGASAAVMLSGSGVLGGEGYVGKVVEHAAKLLPAVGMPGRARGRRSAPTRRIIVPCSDWAVSGVNSALETLAVELGRMGWEIEILFTRDRAFVETSMGRGSHKPRVPHRYLEVAVPGFEGFWMSLMAELERNAPCIVLTAYDFPGNSVIPALSDGVGAVAWVQSDDRDYYEQIYRLGRYCNSVICVSSGIQQTIRNLHPLIGNLTHVIHNSSVQRDEIARRNPDRCEKLRLIYAGRLVQYQKRVFDFIDFAAALDRLGCPFEITLVGAFSQWESTEAVFLERAGAYLADGRIRLAGRLSRDRVLAEFDRHDFYLLLSEFEGLPLSVVEAMARGCVPVCAAMRSGIDEIVRDGVNGLIMTTRNYDEWAARITAEWKGRRKLESMARQARALVRAKFSVEQVARRFDKVLRGIASELQRGVYHRPESLNWGPTRSPVGDILPPPSFIAPPARFPGILNFKGR